MYGEGVVIPRTLKIIKDFHTGHPSIVRKKALTRSNVFWPNMDKNRRKSKILQRLYDTSKDTISKLYPLVKVAYRFCWFSEGTISFDTDFQLLEMDRGDEE